MIYFAFKEVLIINSVLPAKLLQFAVPASYAGKAFFIMIRKKQLQGLLSGFDQSWSIGVYLHPFIDRMHAGGYQISGSFHFNHAHTASADFIDFF